MIENSDEMATIGLPQVTQLGFVVRSLNQWIERYNPLFGPFTTMDAKLTDVGYRDGKADCELKLAFGKSGDIEIEFIEWVSGHSPHREFIEQGREGLHHLQFHVRNIEPWIEKLTSIGYRTIWYQRLASDTAFVYMEKTSDPTFIEFVEIPPHPAA